MNAAALRLPWRALGAHAVAAFTLIVLLALGVPRLLSLDAATVAALQSAALAFTLPGALLGAALTRGRVRRHRHLLRALALGSDAIEVGEVRTLSSLPTTTTLASLGSMALAHAASVLTCAARGQVGADAAVAAWLLGLVLVAAAGLPLQASVRVGVVAALELLDPDVARELLLEVERTGAARRRVARRLALAIVGPVAFIAAGATLLTEAQVRLLSTQAAADTRRDADAVLSLALPPRAPPPAAARRRVRLELQAAEGTSRADLVVLLLAIALAAFVGRELGDWLVSDLTAATDRVRRLGNEEVVRTRGRVLPPARFKVVAALTEAIDALADRFAVFAVAQERALTARAGAARAHALLFAGFSHDLKNPLNAILGFSDLLERAELSPAQHESVAFLAQRARELLAWLEIWLDWSRLDAGQLTLAREPTLVAAWRVTLGRMLADALPETPFDLVRVPGSGTRGVLVDPHRTAQAVAALARALAAGGPRETPISVRAEVVDADLVVELEVPGDGARARELAPVLAGRPEGARRARGTALGLAFARGIARLHGGEVSLVQAEGRDAVRVTFRSGP